MIKPCKWCKETRTYVKGQARGSITSYFGNEGNHIEDYTDKIWFLHSSFVRCENCHRIRKDLIYIDGKVVEKK